MDLDLWCADGSHSTLVEETIVQFRPGLQQVPHTDRSRRCQRTDRRRDTFRRVLRRVSRAAAGNGAPYRRAPLGGIVGVARRGVPSAFRDADSAVQKAGPTGPGISGATAHRGPCEHGDPGCRDYRILLRPYRGPGFRRSSRARWRVGDRRPVRLAPGAYDRTVPGGHGTQSARRQGPCGQTRQQVARKAGRDELTYGRLDAGTSRSCGLQHGPAPPGRVHGDGAGIYRRQGPVLP